MVEEGRFEILVCPENGNGVHSQIMKLSSRTFENLDLVIREIPHVESAIELLNDGHVDMIAVSGNWWYNNPQDDLIPSVILPRREPTRVLVSEDKPEYLPKNGKIIADCELLKRQLHRARPDLTVILPPDNFPNDSREGLSWLEEKRQDREIDGYVVPRSLHALLPNRTRRHTLGLQRDNPERFRFVPVPLEGFTVLLTRRDFPSHKFSEIIDSGAALSFRIECMILEHIGEEMQGKVGILVEQRKVGTVLREAEKRGDDLSRDSIVSHKGDVKGESRIDIMIETLNRDGSVTASIEKVFPPEEIHTSSLVLIKNWNLLFSILKEKPKEEKKTRIKELMNDYIEEMVSQGRISPEKIDEPKFIDY